MSRRSIGWLAVAFTALVGGWLVPSLWAGQSGPSKKTDAAAPAAPYTVPRTPWGHPDFQGIWNNGTTTPLERPGTVLDREYLSIEEVAERNQEANSRADRRPADPKADVELAYNQEWWDRGKALERTSLIIDPREGKLPPLTPEGEKRRAERIEARKGRGPADSWVDRPLQERCLVYHGVPPMPTGYNNNYQFVQTPDHVAVRYEMMAETRIIPLDGRPPLSPAIDQWIGVARGHWEGDTLVVETTNYSPKTTFRFPTINERLKVVERFTRVAEDRMDYQFTVHDPSYAKPWSAVLPMTREVGPIYEYACHEGNYGMSGVLSGHRAEEKAAGKATRK